MVCRVRGSKSWTSLSRGTLAVYWPAPLPPSPSDYTGSYALGSLSADIGLVGGVLIVNSTDGGQPIYVNQPLAWIGGDLLQVFGDHRRGFLYAR